MKTLIAMLLLPLSLILAAQEEPLVAADSQDQGAFFFEATSQYLSFALADLDGAGIIGNADQVFFLPRIRPSLGLGFGFGRRFRSGLWAVTYLVSGHDADFQARESTGVSLLVEVLSRSFTWLKVRDNVADGNGVLHDATYAGVGVNGGAGLLAPLSSRMFFSASLVCRYLGYLYAYGPVKGIDVTDLFDGVSGPRHRRFLRAPVVALELSLGYEL